MHQTQQLKIFNFFEKSDTGHVRAENQDASIHFDSINGYVFALCDGMGGVKGGKRAAEEALSSVRQVFSSDWYEDEKTLINHAFQFANKNIRAKYAKPELNLYPGTTMVLLLVRENKIFYAHAGDSRIYYQTGKKLFCLTEDHSLVMKLLKEKHISEKEAANHEQKNVIYNALGISETVKVDISEKPIYPVDNDFVLLCSDGLNGELSDDKLHSILKSDKNLQEKGEMLMKKALQKGGEDNITLQLIEFYNTGNKKNKEHSIKEDRNSRKYMLIAVVSFAFLLLSTFFMIDYFWKKRAIKNDTYIREKVVVSYDLSFFDNDSNRHIYSVGRNIYAYPNMIDFSMTDILRINKKNDLFFFPGEKILIPKHKKHK